MELRRLRYFIAVAEELNFRRAAERVHIDQTPLSRTIRDLEDQLGVQLVVRAPRKLRLTSSGLRLLKEARKLFIRIERARRVVLDTDAGFSLSSTHFQTEPFRLASCARLLSPSFA